MGKQSNNNSRNSTTFPEACYENKRTKPNLNHSISCNKYKYVICNYKLSIKFMFPKTVINSWRRGFSLYNRFE